jgi:formylglycine-generating enzyme required for sulfatase activity
MVYVPAGEFLMGSSFVDVRTAQELCRLANGRFASSVCHWDAFGDELPQHSVVLDAFWIDQTEVTNAQYEACVSAGACTEPSQRGSFTRQWYYGTQVYADFPVIWVRWEQAHVYCEWAGARLPTEAEWEYAAAGPEDWRFPWGEDFDPTRLNYCDSSCSGVSDEAYSDGFPDTAPAGSFPSGVSWVEAMDMAGNVREWVADLYGPYSAGTQHNPIGPSSGNAHVPKGGSWYEAAYDVRAANRGGERFDYDRHKVGFRCAMDVPSDRLPQ